MNKAWLWRGVPVAALLGVLVTSGCGRKPSQPPVTTPAPRKAPTPAAPATASKTQKEKPKVTESDAVQMARKLGTPTSNKVVTTASGLEYIDVKEGKGEAAKPGDNVKMQYTGWLVNGLKFDSSKDHGGTPFAFPLGGGRVIKGWDEGVVGMKPGGVRKLIIPSDLGYGPQGAGGLIPPNATLIFEVEYVGKQ